MHRGSRRNVKVLMLGESGVGKTSILSRYTDDRFQTKVLTTLGVDFKTKTLLVQDQPVHLQVWDTAGQERFHTITNTYYRNVDGIVVVYDITKKDTLDYIPTWIQGITDNASEGVAVLLVGNKCDAESKRQVTRQQGQQKADEYSLLFAECSAKDSLHIDDMFQALVQKILMTRPSRVEPMGRMTLQEQPRKKSCC